MGKIKNWSKKKEAKNELSWENDETGRELVVSKSMKSGWTILLLNSDGSVQGYVVRKQPTKEKARKEAVKWMRNHPNG